MTSFKIFILTFSLSPIGHLLPKVCRSKFLPQLLFPHQRPYNFLPPFPDHYIALGGEIFVFKPREWRGTNADGAPPFSEGNYLTEAEMAAEINGYEPGSVAHLYLTSDGGMNLPTLSTMVGMLDPERVKVVNHEELTEMARQRSAYLNI